METCIEITVINMIGIASFISDMKSGKIKNIIPFAGVAAGFAINIYFFGTGGIVRSLMGMALPFVLLFTFYALKMLGAGDVKAFCAIGAVCGIPRILFVLAFSFLFGGIIGIIILIRRKIFKESIQNIFIFFKRMFLAGVVSEYNELPNKKNNKFKFGIAVFAGTLFASAYILLPF